MLPSPPVSCFNRELDANESDADCGGLYCPHCAPGRGCAATSDCDQAAGGGGGAPVFCGLRLGVAAPLCTDPRLLADAYSAAAGFAQ